MSNSARLIPLRFHDQIASMPEYSYGVNRIIVTLDNGIRYTDVLVGWGEEILKVKNSEIIPFDPSLIIKVENQ